jgi:EAL domain-containing protein (putative c-di-GMP-specific phosphodiesterase class I)
LEKDEFFLVYQPTFDLRTMSPTGMEALLRWRHPVRGVVQPDDFVPLLEEIGVIAEVGKWVLKEACRQGAAWRSSGYLIGMAVNVSALQIDTDEFVAEIEDALQTSGLEPGALTIEITETAGRLEAVKRLGVRIAIDDFGTGYSSLAYLQRFPVDALKIDRSFISRLTHDQEGETLIRTLVQLGKSLSIETLAEGIEESSELSLLKEEQCDSGQGFLFARPLEVDACETFLSDWIGGEASVAEDVAEPHAQA